MSSLVIVVCCLVEVSVAGRSLVQRNSAECDVSECDRETSMSGRPWAIKGCYMMGKNTVLINLLEIYLTTSMIDHAV